MKTACFKPSCIIEQKKDFALMRLFCFPYAGGGAQVFRQWSDDLPEQVEVCAVQPPGRENRISEPLISDVHDLVNRLLPSIAPLFDKPFAFLGHSTGALVAFEMIRALRRQQMPLPERLIVSAARAPHIPEPFPLHHLPEDEFIRELQRFSGTPEVVLQHKELMSIYLPILRADLAIEETYTFEKEPSIDVPVSAFYGALDKETPKAVMVPWEMHTMASFNLIRMEGGHFFIRTDRASFLSMIARILTQH